MSIDIDLNDMFSEKNKNLFFKKLILDLENNAETFKFATKHIVMIEVAKLLSSLKKTYDRYSVIYDEDKLKALLSKTKTNLIDEINVVIDEKTSTNSSYVENNRTSQINKTYLKGYHKQIDESEDTFKGSLNLTVKEETEINLYNSLVGLYPCSNEEMQQDLLHTINIDFSGAIFNRVSNESKHRSMTLKNMMEETYQKYLDLSKTSGLQKSGDKVKIKKEKQTQ